MSEPGAGQQRNQRTPASNLTAQFDLDLRPLVFIWSFVNRRFHRRIMAQRTSRWSTLRQDRHFRRQPPHRSAIWVRLRVDLDRSGDGSGDPFRHWKRPASRYRPDAPRPGQPVAS